MHWRSGGTCAKSVRRESSARRVRHAQGGVAGRVVGSVDVVGGGSWTDRGRIVDADRGRIVDADRGRGSWTRIVDADRGRIVDADRGRIVDAVRPKGEQGGVGGGRWRW